MARKRKRLTIEQILENSKNVAEILHDSVLEPMAQEILDGYESDLASRQEWVDRSEDAMKLALQISEKKSFPWENAANVKYPLLTIAAIQFAARVDLFNGPDLVTGRVHGWDETGLKTDRAMRIGKHMTYQLREENPYWEDENDVMAHALPIIGTMYKKSYFDHVKKFIRSDLVWPNDLVFDFYAKDVESAFRKTHIIEMRENDITTRVRKGLFLDADLSADPEGPDTTFKQEIEGTSDSGDDDDGSMPRVMLEQHTWYDLDDDGFLEPYAITIDKDTPSVMRIVPRFEKEDIEYNDDGQICDIEPTEYFTGFVFIPNPNGGNMGLGFGHLQGPINETINTLINQLIDAGTLNNLGGGFISSSLRLRKGDYHFKPGEFRSVRASGVELKNSILPLPVQQPSSVLFTLLQLLMEGGERVGSITDVLVGDNPPTNQPATTTLSQVEQGMKVFKRIHKRLWRSHTKEFKKIFDLNKVYLDKASYFNIIDPPKSHLIKLLKANQMTASTKGQLIISQGDYKADDTDVTPSADPNVMTEKERMQKVEILFQTMQIGWNPEVVKKRFVEAANFENPDELMIPPPPPPPDPKLQAEQMKMQLEQAKLQLEAQKMQSDAQMEQAKMQFEVQKSQIEVEKTQMEIAKIEAEIRKILAEVEVMGEDDDGGKLELEANKLLAEHDIKNKELLLKERELELKDKEIDSNERVAMSTKEEETNQNGTN
jgi:chaperonin GroES